jgi:hypothetical protein
MAKMIEAVIEFCGEVVLELLFELLMSLGIHTAPRRKTPSDPWLAATGYLFIGAVIGGASLLLAPTLFVTHPIGRIANLILAPIVSGMCMWGIGAWRAKRGKDVYRVDTFWYGYLFAFGIGLSRFLMTR